MKWILLSKQGGENKRRGWKTREEFDKRGGGNKRLGWRTRMDFDKRAGGIFFSGGWYFSELVSQTLHLLER